MRHCRSSLLGLALILVFVSLIGCGGGGGPVKNFPVQTQSISGKVETAVFGGMALNVVSAWKASTPVDGTGNYATTVSLEGTQLIFLVDEQEELRGLALSNPIASGRDASVVFNTASTAEALIYMTPGILVTNPAEYPVRSEQIRSLSSFPAFTSYLSTQLLQKSIDEFVILPEFQQLLHNCVQEFFIVTGTGNGRSSDWLNQSDPASMVYMTVDENPSDPALTQVKFENWGWRYVEIVRREMVGETEQRVSVLDDGSFEVFGGAIPMSWGNLWKIDFTSWPPTNTEVGNPNIRFDTVDISADTQITTYEYWVRGPGFADGASIPPASVEGGILDTYGATTLCYVVVPTLDLFLGFAGDVSKRMETFAAVYQTYKLSIDTGKLTTLSVQEPGSQAFTTALGNLAVDMLELTVNSETIRSALIERGVLSAQSVPYIQLALKVGAVGISAGNLYMVGDTLKNVPRYSKARIFNRNGGIIVIIE